MGSANDRDRELAVAATVAGVKSPISDLSTEDGSQPAPPATQPDLAHGTTLDKRYVVERVLGRGGMGTVYLARDTSLGRDIALKLHSSGTGHERLYLEAVAMAQLAHPNVVNVFEVGTVDDQLFVAMEYIRGTTLRGWYTDHKRTWREVIALLIDAGEGLAAAHRAGLTHRDFKPENVLVGDDGRPRVSDFGLARVSSPVTTTMPTISSRDRGSASQEMPTTGQPTPMTPMTKTGSILGTPAYMAPEQYVAGDVDARSDQFTFCVVAWEALFGQRPFPGETSAQVQQAIERGNIVAADETGVPAAVRKALRRGLAPQPQDRWPDMTALLAALRRTLQPRTARRFALAGAGMVAAAGAIAFAATGHHEPRCDGAGAEIDVVFTPAARAQLIALGARDGADTEQRTRVDVDRFIAGYRAAAVDACRAVGHHDWSADVDARSGACRRERARIAAAQEAILVAAAPPAHRALVFAAELGGAAPFDECRDPAALLSAPLRAPEIEDARVELLALRRFRLASAADRTEAAIHHAESSPLATRPGVIAPLTAARAQLAYERKDLTGAIHAMTDAYYQAHADGDHETEIDALWTLLQWIGNEREDLPGVEPWYRLALAEVDRFARISPLEAGRMRNAVVGVAVQRNELKVAIDQARLAAQTFEHGPPLERLSALREYANALATAGDVDHSLPLYDQAIRAAEDAFGPDEPQLAPLLTDQALTFNDAGRYAEAVKVGERALAIAHRAPTRTLETANIELNVAVTMLGAEDHDRAEPLLLAARATFAELLGADNPVIATVDSDLSLVAGARKQPAEAVKLLRSALAIQDKALGTDHIENAATLYNLAAALRDAGDLPGALAAARRCVDIRAKALPESDLRVFALLMQADIEGKLGHHDDQLRDASAATEVRAPRADFQTTAWAQLEQAHALVELGRDAETARRLVEAARAAYAANKVPERVAEADALLARLATGARTGTSPAGH